MKDLSNWTEITKGLYRYVIGANCCYEIHILYHSKDTDILTAKASAYIVGDWYTSKPYSSFFERQCLLENQPVFECLEAVIKDIEDNNK